MVDNKTSKANKERISIPNVVMEGSINSGLLCTCTTNKLLKMVYADKSLLCKHKDAAEVPPLEVVDDILTIS